MAHKLTEPVLLTCRHALFWTRTGGWDCSRRSYPSQSEQQMANTIS